MGGEVPGSDERERTMMEEAVGDRHQVSAISLSQVLDMPSLTTSERLYLPVRLPVRLDLPPQRPSVTVCRPALFTNTNSAAIAKESPRPA